jgi:anti-sigma B factor antagonist
MQIDLDTRNNISVFNLRGRLDSNTSPELEAVIASQIENGSNSMIINFENLDYISSAGLRVILKTTKDLKRREGKLMLCAMQDYVKEVFEIAGFDTFLPIVPTMDDAISSI